MTCIFRYQRVCYRNTRLQRRCCLQQYQGIVQLCNYVNLDIMEMELLAKVNLALI